MTLPQTHKLQEQKMIVSMSLETLILPFHLLFRGKIVALTFEWDLGGASEFKPAKVHHHDRSHFATCPRRWPYSTHDSERVVLFARAYNCKEFMELILCV